MGVGKKKIEKEALTTLQTVNWTGNIRELRNVVERLIILSEKTIKSEDVINYVMPSSAAPTTKPSGIKALLDQFSSIEELKAFVNEKQ